MSALDDDAILDACNEYLWHNAHSGYTVEQLATAMTALYGLPYAALYVAVQEWLEEAETQSDFERMVHTWRP